MTETEIPRVFKRDDSVGYRHEIIPPDRADDCPYMERWIVGFGPGMFAKAEERDEDQKAWFSLRLHHFFRSDEDHLHDHPTWFWAFVLRGSYEDWVECKRCKGSGLAPGPWNHRLNRQGTEPCDPCGGTGQVLGTRMVPGKIRYRPALHRHRVVTDGCWTLCLFGPKKRDWGFYTPEGWLRNRAYFRKYGGSAACE